MLWSDLSAYALLFLAAFAAASILTFPSEPLLIGMLLSERYNSSGLWLLASLGNTLGAVLNWWLARYALRWQDRRWFPVKPAQLAKASGWFQRYGVWSLLLAWVPIVGDALTFAGGLFRVRLWLFMVLVGVGKAGRYAVIIWGTQTVVL